MTGTTPSSQSSMPTSNGKETSGYTLRMATVKDAQAVASLIGTVWSKHFAYSVTPDDLAQFLSTSLSPAQITADIQNSSMHFLIATTPTNDVIGVVQLVEGTREDSLTLPDPIELRRLYVADAYHGGGVAKTLVHSVEEIAAKDGHKSLWLGAWEGNARGIRFYEKMGFKSVGQKTFLAGGSMRKDWVMEKAL